MLKNDIESLVESLDIDIDYYFCLYQDEDDGTEAEYFRGYSDACSNIKQKLEEILLYQKIYGE